MKATDFIEMQKQDIETHKDKAILSEVVAAMAEAVKGCPNVEIEPTKTAEECYKKMYETAKKDQKGGYYVFTMQGTLKFVRGYLGIKESDISSEIKDVPPKKEKKRRTLEEFF